MTLRKIMLASVVATSFGLGGAAFAQQAQDINPSPMPPGSRAGDSPRMQGGSAPSNVPGANAQQVNPSAMVPGSRANEAQGMNPGAGAQGQGPAPGTSGVATPSNQIPQQPGARQGSLGSPQPMGTGQGTSANTLQGTGPTTAQGATNPDRGIPGGSGVQSPSAQPDVGRGTAPGLAEPRRDPGATQGSNATGATTPGGTTQGGGAAAGANSFTESQARARMTDAGFNDVQDLRLDEQGVWRGRAMRGGQQTSVSLDYQGNVVPGTR